MSDRFSWIINTAHKKEIFHWQFFSECDQICSSLRIRSHLLKKFLIENLIFMHWNRWERVVFLQKLFHDSNWNLNLQRRIRNHGKHLKWSVLWEQLTAERRQLFPGNANAASKMSDRVLNTLLELVIKDEEQEWFYKIRTFFHIPNQVFW